MARSEDEARPRSAGAVQLRFEIGAYSPKTMPMARLARYLDNLATVLGEIRSVHLVSVDEGSTVPVLAVDPEAYGKVRQRAAEVHNKEAPPGVLKASRAIEADLAAENARHADVIDHQGTLEPCFEASVSRWRIRRPVSSPAPPSRSSPRSP